MPPRTGISLTDCPSTMFANPLNPRTLPRIAPMKMMMMEAWVTYTPKRDTTPLSAYRWSVPLFSVTTGLPNAPPMAAAYESAHFSIAPFFFQRSTSPRLFSRFSSRVRFGFRTTLTTRGRRSSVQHVRFTVNRTSSKRNHQEWYMSNRPSLSNNWIVPSL